MSGAGAMKSVSESITVSMAHRNQAHREAIKAAADAAGAETLSEWLRAVWAHFSEGEKVPRGYLRPRRKYAFGAVQGRRTAHVVLTAAEHEAHQAAAEQCGLTVAQWRLLVADVAAGISGLAEQLRKK